MKSRYFQRKYKKNRRSKIEHWISISAIIISISAFTVSVWQGWETRQHNRLSLMPYITAAPIAKLSVKEDGVLISNDGLGTGFIIDAYIIANGKKFDLTTNTQLEIYKFLDLDNSCFTRTYLPIGASLKPSETVRLFSPTQADIHKIHCLIEYSRLFSQQLELYISYQSIYQKEGNDGSYTFHKTVSWDEVTIKEFEPIIIKAQRLLLFK